MINNQLINSINQCKNILIEPHSPSFDLGSIGILPWGPLTNFPDRNARWIWNTINAVDVAPVNVKVTFQKLWNNNTGANIIAKIYIVVDNYAQSVTVNNEKILFNTKNGSRYDFYGGWFDYENNTEAFSTIGEIILIPGFNLLSITAFNMGGSAGLLYTIIN